MCCIALHIYIYEYIASLLLNKQKHKQCYTAIPIRIS